MGPLVGERDTEGSAEGIALGALEGSGGLVGEFSTGDRVGRTRRHAENHWLSRTHVRPEVRHEHGDNN